MAISRDTMLRLAANLAARSDASSDRELSGDLDDLRDELALLVEANKRALRLFEEALPKFNWGASTLDANAITLLNEVPGELANALKPFLEG